MKLKNIWHEVLTLFKPQGDPQSVTVEPGQVVEVPGELAADQPHSDAIVVEHPDGELMAYPKTLWNHVDAAPSESGDSRPEPDATPAGSTPDATTATPPVESVIPGTPVSTLQPPEPTTPKAEG